MSSRLENYLYPAGRSASEPNLMPSVKDSDGNDLAFSSAKRKTSESTVVNLGTAPNANNGDPLRTAFGKINNFIEATYWFSDALNGRLDRIDSELKEGFLLYTDSDIKHNISLTEDTRLRLLGTTNQIELSTKTLKSTNSTNTHDSEIHIKFQLTETVDISTLNVKEHANFDSDVKIRGNLVVDDHADVLGRLYVKENALFDSDVQVNGSLIVMGTTTAVNSQQLQVQDPLIVLGTGQTSPILDTGIIHTRYDSDTVSSANWNAIYVWDETNDEFVLGQTDASGILPNPTITQKYFSASNSQVKFYDSDNSARVIWDKNKSTLTMENSSGGQSFVFDLDAGLMTGDGTGAIDGGTY